MKQVTRSLLTLGLVGAVGGGIALMAWLRSGEVALDPQGTADKRLLPFEPSDVTSLTVTVKGNAAQLAKDNEGWKILSPVSLGADETIIDKMLGQLETARAKTEFGTAERPEVPADGLTGLAVPQSVLTLVTPAGELTLEVGDVSEYNRESYARVKTPERPEGRVLTISPSTAGLIQKSWSDLRDTRAAGASTARIAKVRVEPNPVTDEQIVFELERIPPDPNLPRYRQKDRWQANTPDVGLPDQKVALDVLQSLARAPISELLTMNHQGDLAAYGLGDPAWRVTLWLAPFGALQPGAEPIRRTLLIGPVVDEKVVLAREDQTWVGKAHESLTYGLKTSVEHLKSKRVFNFDRTDVARIELDLTEAGQIILEKGGESAGGTSWRMLAPQPAVAKAHRATSLVLAYAELVGERRVAEGAEVGKAAVLKRYGLDEGVQTVRFLASDGETMGTLLIGKRAGDKAYAMAEGGQFIVELPASRLDPLPLSAAELIDTR